MSTEAHELAVEVAWERLQEAFDKGDYDEEFVYWCVDRGIHKDYAPDYEESFLEDKLEEIIDNWS